MLSCDSGQGSEELLCTPRRAQKRLFGAEESSTKRSLFQQPVLQRENDSYSGDESDLGPMSPLALTDNSPSSTYSSPGRQFVSPLASPEGSPQIPLMNLTWDRLKPASGYFDKRLSPFSSLKHVTRAARSSPRRIIFPPSPKSTHSPSKNLNSLTPNRTRNSFSQEIVPETPLRDCLTDIQNENSVAETPQKEDGSEHKMITPLGSVNKDASLPRLHRRKTLGALDVIEISPEKKSSAVKRHINDPIIVKTKLQKTDDSCSIPRARASLFQDKKQEDNITMDTKSFYGSGKQKIPNAFGLDWKQFDKPKKRRSLPSHHVQKSGQRHLTRKSMKGEINSGVSHGIKRPKPKKHISRVEAFKNEKRVSPPVSKAGTENINTQENSSKNTKSKASQRQKAERSPTPEFDLNKRFFKMIRSKNATVTVNKKIKLDVSDGKISLKQKNVHKKPKLDFTLDAADLIVDEPEFENTKEKDVAKLLKILEDDWTDDDYEPIELLQKKKITNSPNKYSSFQDVVMSPASELSNMTSVMNIEDTVMQTEDKINFNIGEENKNIYPLFTKGYSSNHREVIIPRNRGVKRSATWQLAANAGGAEDQYQLDCGQKKFGATQCNECGVVYQLGDPADENAHLNFHNSFKTLKFHGWKNEKMVWNDEYTKSRIIVVEPNDPKQCWKKVTEILNVVDMDLGLADKQLSCYKDMRIYLYIREKNVLGVLLVEPVKEAHRMIPELVELDCCTSESTPVKCGINVVWTAMKHRKQGIARQLVDTLR